MKILHKKRGGEGAKAAEVNTRGHTARLSPVPAIEVGEPESYSDRTLSPEGNVKFRNYRLVGADALRAYTPSGDVHTTPTKRKLVSRFEHVCPSSPPRRRILELITEDQPGADELAAIVRPTAVRGPALSHPAAAVDDSWAFLLNPLPSPSHSKTAIRAESPRLANRSSSPSVQRQSNLMEFGDPSVRISSLMKKCSLDEQYVFPSLSEELRLADGNNETGSPFSDVQMKRRLTLRERRQRALLSVDAAQMARLALSVETDDWGGAASTAPDVVTRELDSRLRGLIKETRELRQSAAEIRQDFQAAERRALAVSGEARALAADVRALRYLDDVLVLLRGQASAAARVAARRRWPLAADARARPDPTQSYIV